jgi:CheY-like chemotaxis protein
MLPNSTHTALVIDDNFFNRDIFKIALETAGYNVTQAEGGAEGISELERDTFDLLVLDLQMPTVDGRSVLRTLRTNPLHKNMRIVIVTANPHMATDELTDIADYVMYKPINVVEFSEFARRLRSMFVPRV